MPDSRSAQLGGSDSAVIADLLRQAQDDHQSIDALGREVSRLREALTMIAGMPTTERNPDGAEQAAWSMQLVAQEALNMGESSTPLTIDGVTVQVPADMVLVSRAEFERCGQAFDYIARKIDEHGVDPERDEDHGLIFARAEARDSAAYCKERAKESGYTSITTAAGPA